MSDYRKAKRDFTKERHHNGDVSAATLKNLADVAIASKSQRNINAATSAIRVHTKRQNADTFESRAKKKVVDGMNKSSIGNHILGWFSPKHAR